MFIAKNFTKFAEKDVYGEGCIPDTEIHVSVDITFTGETIEDLILEVSEYFGVDTDYIQVKPDCMNVLEFSVLETQHGLTATDKQIESWKNGNIDLWNSIYDFEIVKEESIDFNNDNLI